MTATLKKIAYQIIIGFLRNQTKRWLRLNPQIKIVAVTGSVGKTTTKHAIAAVLKQRYKVLVDPKSYNTETGLPLAIFELESPGKILSPRAWFNIWLTIERKLRQQPSDYEIAVLEMGADEAGEISYFMKFIKPDLGVITAMKPAHMGGFKDMVTLMNEKFQLALGSSQVLLNGEDERVMAKAKELDKNKPVKVYGLTVGDYRIEPKSFNLKNGWEGDLRYGKEQSRIRVKLVGRHNLQSAAAAAAAGDFFGLTSTSIVKGLAIFSPMNGRMNLLKGKNGSLIIDDTYNSNPEAVTAALDTLYGLEGRKIATLGSMNEMGEREAEYHKAVGEYCGRLDVLVTIGENAAKYLAPAAKNAGAKEVKSFDSPFEAGRYVAKSLREGDKVLVKGSQNRVFAEEATAILLADPADRDQLVRQSPFWKKIKQQQFGE